jgi:uncharacterized iron-regulated membrane protein
LLTLVLAFTGLSISTLWREGKMPDVGANPTQRQVHQFQSVVAFFPLVFAALTGASLLVIYFVDVAASDAVK